MRRKKNILFYLISTLTLLISICICIRLTNMSKEKIASYQFIDASDFNKNVDTKHIFLKGKLETDTPVIFEDKEYAFVRHSHFVYTLIKDIKNFDYEGTIWEDKDVLNASNNASYNIDIADNLHFGNLYFETQDLNLFTPYVILQETDNREQDIYSVIDKDMEGIIYIKSVSHGTISEMRFYRSFDEAINDLYFPYPIFIFVFIIIYFMSIGIHEGYKD